MSKKQVDLVTRFAALFPGLTRAYGVYQLITRSSGGKKITGKAHTEQGEVTRELWEMHLHGKQGLGIVPINDDNQCSWGAIDVDHYNLKLAEVEESCARHNLPLLPTRTKSGGIHLYLFTQQPIPAKLMKAKLEDFAVILGYGGAEVFPKQEALLSKADIGNWLNMPYFNALQGKTERYGIFKGVELPLEGFCQRADQIKVTVEQLEKISVETPPEFEEGPPCLQSLGISGFVPGMRNDGLFAVGVYLKKRYPDDWGAHVHAYNVRFFKPPIGDSEIKPILKSLSRKDYNFPCSKPPIVNYCNKELCRTRRFGVGQDVQDWNIAIDTGNVLKILTDPPYWIVTVNGHRIRLTAEDWSSQKLFGDRCINHLNYYPGKLSSGRWRAEVNKVLQAAKDTPAPPEASSSGELEDYLRQFCTVYAQAETREEILTGKPFIEDGVVYFRSQDFKKYLESQHFRALNGPKLYAHLRDVGLEDKQIRIGVQNYRVWTIPAYELAAPEVPPRKVTTEGAM
jgi:hypothetical protein